MFKPVTPQINFPELEKEILEYWNKNAVVDKYLKRNEISSKLFSFLDGPITANNPMGVHHGWGRTYKDLWQRYFTMKGYKERYQNGFDCQGLWVEVEVEKELGLKNKKDIENLIPGDKEQSIAKFVDLCKARVTKFSAIQSEQSKRLGYFMDWDHSYYTMSDENNYMIWHFLKTCHEKGWIYTGIDSVPWCPRCETAISQHEMLTEDYKELTHETVFLRLPIITKGWTKTDLLIWTTTPWTIPANVAVAVNPEFNYGVWEHFETHEKIIIIQTGENGTVPKRLLKGKELTIDQYIFGNSPNAPYKCVKTIPGHELIGLTYQGPFDELPVAEKARKSNPKTFHTVVDGSNLVVSTEGTGLLHVAPGAGKEDFDLGKKEHLPVISVITDDASYNDQMGAFRGMNAKKHPEIIIDHLKKLENGRFLLKTLQFTHRYPACWRCKTELVWKVAEEWYIAMDTVEKTDAKNSRKSKSTTLRQQMIETAKMIDWRPAFGLDRELDWLSHMSDWLISKKNRYWGLALPIFVCTCGWFDVIGSKEELKSRSVQGWEKFEGKSPHKPYIDAVKIRCESCGKMVSRVDDVGNVWLDAGIVPFSTYLDPETKRLSYTSDKKYWKQWFPADFITESFPGQFKNWFYSMIAMSTVLEKRNPFKTVLGYASVLGEDGRPMHKSWGNSIEFNEAAGTIGVDVMRWLYVTHQPEINLLFGRRRADEARRSFHLILWNIYNFFITYANVDGWDGKKLDLSKQSDNVLDLWIVSKLNNLLRTVSTHLDNYDAYNASTSISGFVEDFSTWYIRRCRDRVGPVAVNLEDKTDFYNTCFTILTTLSKILAPFIPFVSEEIYRNLTQELSIHLSDWPQIHESLINTKLENEMAVARKIVELSHSARKSSGNKIRQPLSKMNVIKGKKSVELSAEIEKLVLEELNIKFYDKSNSGVSYIKPSKSIDDKTGLQVTIETELSKDLIEEGTARDIVRSIQIKRKELGCSLTDHVRISLPSWPLKYEEYILRHTLGKELKTNSSLLVERV